MFSPAVSVREQEIEKFTPNQSFGLDPRVYQFHHSYHFFYIITSATLGEPQFPRCLRR
jgi:hypothetical protein